MLKNYITDTDLKKLHPKLANFIWSTQADYSTQITEAFNIILDDIRARGIEARTMMVPIDCLLAATDHTAQDKLTSETCTTSENFTHVDGRDGFNRFVVVTSAYTAGGGACTVAIQGSNDVDVDDSTEPTNWTAITSVTVTAAATQSSVFQTEYKYYRVVVTSTATTITFTAGMYETFVDRWIMYKTLELICRDFSRVQNDVWDERAKLYGNMYANAFQNYKFTVDSDDDNRIDDSDLDATGQATFCR